MSKSIRSFVLASVVLATAATGCLSNQSCERGCCDNDSTVVPAYSVVVDDTFGFVLQTTSEACVKNFKVYTSYDSKGLPDYKLFDAKTNDFYMAVVVPAGDDPFSYQAIRSVQSIPNGYNVFLEFPLTYSNCLISVSALK